MKSMIKTYGQRGDSFIGRRVKHSMALNENDIVSGKNIPCESTFVLENTELKFDGPEENYRPWMEFSGYIKELHGDFPCDIKEIQFSEKKRFDARFRYDFSDMEIAELAKKGLFSRGYVERGLNEPEIFFEGNELDFPVLVDANVVKDNKGSNHAVFIDIQSRYYIEIDAESSGYTDGFAQHYADLEEVRLKEAEENKEMFIEHDEQIETINDIELLDTVSENSHILTLEDENETEINEENEVSLFEKYGIEKEAYKRNQEYQKELKKRAREYQMEQATIIEEKQQLYNEKTDNLLNIDISNTDIEEKRNKYRQKLTQKSQIAEKQKNEIKKAVSDLENEDMKIDESDYDFI